VGIEIGMPASYDTLHPARTGPALGVEDVQRHVICSRLCANGPWLGEPRQRFHLQRGLSLPQHLRTASELWLRACDVMPFCPVISSISACPAHVNPQRSLRRAVACMSTVLCRHCGQTSRSPSWFTTRQAAMPTVLAMTLSPTGCHNSKTSMSCWYYLSVSRSASLTLSSCHFDQLCLWLP